jgi:hypothetical protein
VRPVMPGNPISLKALVRVAEARASYFAPKKAWVPVRARRGRIR